MDWHDAPDDVQLSCGSGRRLASQAAPAPSARLWPLGLLLLLLCLVLPAHAQDFRDPPAQPFTVWPNIPVIRAADLADYEADRKLFGDLHADKADPAKVTAALQAVDRLQAHHERRAMAQLGRSVNTQLIAELDRLARDARLARPKLRFDFADLTPEDLQNPTPPAELKAKAARIQLAAYITYTRLEGSLVQASATLVKLRTGASQSFSVTAPVTKVADALARELFDYFEGTRFAAPRAPLPGVQWLPAAPGHADQLVSRDAAQAWCQAQGAQLPTAAELQAAEAAGFHAGGVALRPAGAYHVQSGLYDTATAAAGAGALRENHLGSVPNGSYYCVRHSAPVPGVRRASAGRSDRS
ncbi:hypothetical protein SAMN05428957_11157 [Oryzisolibacter propanilivorax]|uniref:Uncharacterized protein n=1 Tax=Oryzisolibacter propanilivorax TaxID=1527607 RepID=A0A1G9V5V9_9BURK|nr:hypothetical protein [Oryzisolibacter propanilivorax]SDM67588.1 hypothetical protein SAMN05428957_11157 [Oryzisolibacter propanilivorax]